MDSCFRRDELWQAKGCVEQFNVQVLPRSTLESRIRVCWNFQPQGNWGSPWLGIQSVDATSSVVIFSWPCPILSLDAATNRTSCPLQVVDVSHEFGVERAGCCRPRLPDPFFFSQVWTGLENVAWCLFLSTTLACGCAHEFHLLPMFLSDLFGDKRL